MNNKVKIEFKQEVEVIFDDIEKAKAYFIGKWSESFAPVKSVEEAIEWLSGDISLEINRPSHFRHRPCLQVEGLGDFFSTANPNTWKTEEDYGLGLITIKYDDQETDHCFASN